MGSGGPEQDTEGGCANRLELKFGISCIVMLNSFQHPSCLPDRSVQAEKWTLKQVQGDDFANETNFVSTLPRYTQSLPQVLAGRHA
jgi:hypothetical protein